MGGCRVGVEWGWGGEGRGWTEMGGDGRGGTGMGGDGRGWAGMGEADGTRGQQSLCKAPNGLLVCLRGRYCCEELPSRGASVDGGALGLRSRCGVAVSVRAP